MNLLWCGRFWKEINADEWDNQLTGQEFPLPSPPPPTPSFIFSCWDVNESNFVSCQPIKVPNDRCILTLSLHLIAGELTSDRLYSSLRRTFGRHDNRKIMFLLNLVAGQTICRLFQNIFSSFHFNIPLFASLQEWLFREDVLSSAFITASLYSFSFHQRGWSYQTQNFSRAFPLFWNKISTKARTRKTCLCLKINR